MGELASLILSAVRSNFQKRRAAPTSKSLYSRFKRRDPNSVDDALLELVATGSLRITDGRWFEVGVPRSELEKFDADRARIRADKVAKGKARGPKKTDNRKPTKAPRGFKRSAAKRTAQLPGVAP